MRQIDGDIGLARARWTSAPGRADHVAESGACQGVHLVKQVVSLADQPSSR
jgi:hypothetical protein